MGSRSSHTRTIVINGHIIFILPHIPPSVFHPGGSQAHIFFICFSQVIGHFKCQIRESEIATLAKRGRVS
jgi:hypothetical protein